MSKEVDIKEIYHNRLQYEEDFLYDSLFNYVKYLQIVGMYKLAKYWESQIEALTETRLFRQTILDRLKEEQT